jgi:GDP-L-fucose synthase
MTTPLETKILLTGASGMVGSFVKKELEIQGFNNIATATSREVDLRDQSQVRNWVQKVQPEIAILCAARVGGVFANSTFPATFSIENLLMQTLILDQLVKVGVEKIIFIGSSCIYPTEAKLPLTPDTLMTGTLEQTNTWYAMAKLSMISALDGVKRQHGIKTSTILPTNLYGPGDNFDLINGHVLPSLLLKTHQAKIGNLPSVQIWGSGNPMRETLFVGDLAEAIVRIAQVPDPAPVVNLGSGDERSIQELAEEVKLVVGYKGSLKFDQTKPDGVFRKPLNSEYIRSIGWEPKVTLSEGLKETYDWMLRNMDTLRKNAKIEG